jgi:hypothetical protein
MHQNSRKTQNFPTRWKAQERSCACSALPAPSRRPQAQRFGGERGSNRAILKNKEHPRYYGRAILKPTKAETKRAKYLGAVNTRSASENPGTATVGAGADSQQPAPRQTRSSQHQQTSDRAMHSTAKQGKKRPATSERTRELRSGARNSNQ